MNMSETGATSQADVKPPSDPEALRALYAAPAEDDPARLAQAGEQIIKSHAAYVAAVSLVPLVGVDLVAVGLLQIRMLGQLTELYGYQHQWSDGLGRQIIGVVLADTAGGALAGSLAKLFPPFGFASAIVGPAAGGAATLALGRLFHVHYASGGNLLNFNPEKARRQLQLANKAAKRPLD
jgi:uncharacterized protein (DUF697 family)